MSQQIAAFLVPGGTFPEEQAISSPSATQRTPNITVQSFIATFATPHFADFKYVHHTGTSVSVPLSDSTLAANLLFPEKTVSQIVAGKYIDLGDLLSVNIVQTEPELQAFLDRPLVFCQVLKSNADTSGTL